MNETTISLMQMFFFLCFIGAGFSMMLHAVMAYRILAASALFVVSLLSCITWGPSAVVGVFVTIFIVLPIVCLAIVNFGLFLTWRAIRNNGYSQEPNRPPGGYVKLAKVYRAMLLSTG